jgi:hypothetical protein
MSRILISYGEFNGYQIAELPQGELEVLAIRFPLCVQNSPGLDREDLVITIAIHEELRRREKGGQPLKKVASLQELASEIIAKGFRVVSKIHHPDLSGDNSAQLRLNDARDQLLKLADAIESRDDEQDTIFVAAPPVIRSARTPEHAPDFFGSGITDDDVPF